MSAIQAIAHNDAICERCEAIVRRCLNLGTVRSIDPAHDFAEELKADSLDMIGIAMAVEEEFGFEVSDDEAASIQTVGGMIALVRERLA